MGNKHTTFNKADKVGYQVTSVSPLSPGADCGLKSKEDYIIKINGDPVSSTAPDLILEVVQTSLNRPITLAVYSAKKNAIREVQLTPSTKWPGEGLIGIKMKLTTYNVAPLKPRS